MLKLSRHAFAQGGSELCYRMLRMVACVAGYLRGLCSFY
jgi:hypothetical protein